MLKNNIAEKLLFSNQRDLKKVLRPGVDFNQDITTLDKLPSLIVEEDVSKAKITKNLNESTVIKLYFNDLNEATGTIAKILVYYIETKDKVDSVSDNTSLSSLQNEKVFLVEYPVLDVNNSVMFNSKIDINGDNNYFSFYAVYMDSFGRVINKDGKNIVSTCYNVFLNGINRGNSIIGVTGVTIDGLNEVDFQGQGFARTVRVSLASIDLSWDDINKIDTTDELDKYYGKVEDTYGRASYLTLSRIKQFKQYLIYRYSPNEGLPPYRKFPAHIDKKTLKPMLTDPNGKWSLIGKTEDSKFTVKLENSEIYGFWVGVEFYD